MSKLRKGLNWIGDVVQVLILDRLDPARKTVSQQASTACRAIKFHAHSKIVQLDLREVVARLGGEKISTVSLPGPSTDLGDVGSQVTYHALASIVQALRPKTILEIGTYLGVSAYTMALNAPGNCQIFTVDLPDDASARADHELNAIDSGHITSSRHRVGDAFLGSPVQKQITQIREDSMTFRAEKWLNDADLVYVDGGHSLPLVTKDTENAFRVLSPTGTIIWDDYFHLYPDVVRFLNETSERLPLHGIKGTNYVVYSRRWNREDRHRVRDKGLP